MADNPPPGTSPSHLWAHLEAHLICARTSQAAAQGWLIDGMSVTFSLADQPATGRDPDGPRRGDPEGPAPTRRTRPPAALDRPSPPVAGSRCPDPADATAQLRR